MRKAECESCGITITMFIVYGGAIDIHKAILPKKV